MPSSDPVFLQQLYDSEIYHIKSGEKRSEPDKKEKVTGSLTLSGGKAGIVVLTSSDPGTSETDLLDKILGSIGESLQTVESKTTTQLPPIGAGVRLILAFGVEIDDDRAISTIPLLALMADISAKKALWAKLKSL